MARPSATPTDHLNAMYEAWCNGMSQNDLYGCFYHMLCKRHMSFYVEDIQELGYYVDCFEYGLDPVDPAFCHECRTVLQWMMAAT